MVFVERKRNLLFFHFEIMKSFDCMPFLNYSFFSAFFCCQSEKSDFFFSPAIISNISLWLFVVFFFCFAFFHFHSSWQFVFSYMNSNCHVMSFHYLSNTLIKWMFVLYSKCEQRINRHTTTKHTQSKLY